MDTFDTLALAMINLFYSGVTCNFFLSFIPVGKSAINRGAIARFSSI